MNLERISKNDIQTKADNFTKTVSDPEVTRLNKYLSDCGICSRREADRMIEAGRVTVDGITAVLGQKVRKDQSVYADGKPVTPDERLILLAVHKPVGIECTTSAKVTDNIIDFIDYPVRVFPIGRLDKNSSGLILLTNTGAISDQILRGSNYHEKEYDVTVDRIVTPEFIMRLESGVEIELDDGSRKVMTRPCRAIATGKRSFRIILTQGLNRQIRRLCESLGFHVVSLKRIRIMNILLGDLKEGQYRRVTDEELHELLEQLS